MTTNTEYVAPLAAEAASSVRSLVAADARMVRAEALELAAAGLGNRDSSIWEILYAAEWIIGDFAAATSWVPVDTAGDDQ